MILVLSAAMTVKFCALRIRMTLTFGIRKGQDEDNFEEKEKDNSNYKDNDKD